MRFGLSKRYCFAALLAGFVFLAACERDVPNAQLPEAGSKLAATCFISPQDTVLEAYVFQSFPIGGTVRNQGVQIENATVTLSDGSRSVTLPFVKTFPNLPISYSYRVSAKGFPIEAGKTYFLKVSVPDSRQVEAQCTVPAGNNTLSVQVDSSNASGFGGSSNNSKVYRYRYSWQDAPGRGDYYRVAGDVRDSLSRTSYTSGPLYWDGNDIVTDVGFDGTRLTTTSDGRYFQREGGRILYAYLLTTDEAYYRYHATLRQSRESDSNPFAEPVLVYTNMKNGLGVFAAFNRHTLVVRLK